MAEKKIAGDEEEIFALKCGADMSLNRGSRQARFGRQRGERNAVRLATVHARLDLLYGRAGLQQLKPGKRYSFSLARFRVSIKDTPAADGTGRRWPAEDEAIARHEDDWL